MAKKKVASNAPQEPPGDAKKKSKGKKNAENEVSDPNAKITTKNLQNRAKVTSSASWTGKLPHTLLHENCQKRKWNKVEYEMKKIGDKGLIAVALISFTDPKTKENLVIRMNDPTFDKATGKGLLLPQETPIEARHFAATVALYRISYNTNLHMMLPPNHKKLALV